MSIILEGICKVFSAVDKAFPPNTAYEIKMGAKTYAQAHLCHETIKGLHNDDKLYILASINRDNEESQTKGDSKYQHGHFTRKALKNIHWQNGIGTVSPHTKNHSTTQQSQPIPQ